MKRNKIERAEAHEHSTAPSDADGFARDAAHDGVLRTSGDVGPNSAQADSSATYCEDRIGAGTNYKSPGRYIELAIHSDHNLLDSLRSVLRRFETDMGHDPQGVADLKRILRERIAELEAA